MAFTIDNTSSTIEVILSKDSAVKCDSDSYEKYLETLDESLLELDGEPTRFVLRKNLPYEASRKVMNAQATYVKGEVQLQMSYVLEEVRASLIDIKNPSDLPKDKCLNFKKENDGLCSKEIVGWLQSYGVLMDLYRARSAVATSSQTDLAKKN